MNAKSFRLLAPLCAASLALTVLSGCGKSGPTSTLVSRELPVEPTWAREVHVRHSADEDELTAAGIERAGRLRANDIIACFATWYRNVRREYGSEAADQQASEINQRCAADKRDAIVKRR